MNDTSPTFGKDATSPRTMSVAVQKVADSGYRTIVWLSPHIQHELHFMGKEVSKRGPSEICSGSVIVVEL